jgi:hypothetical protein
VKPVTNFARTNRREDRSEPKRKGRETTNDSATDEPLHTARSTLRLRTNTFQAQTNPPNP